MAYTLVTPELTKRANQLREMMIQAAVDFAAGRIDSSQFSEIQAGFCSCYDFNQPQSPDHKQFVMRRLRNFYPVRVLETYRGFEVEYRHSRLPKRKRVTIPDGLLDDRQPYKIGISNTSADPLDVTMLAVNWVDRFGKGPHHLTIEWATEEEMWAT